MSSAIEQALMIHICRAIYSLKLTQMTACGGLHLDGNNQKESNRNTAKLALNSSFFLNPKLSSGGRIIRLLNRSKSLSPLSTATTEPVHFCA